MAEEKRLIRAPRGTEISCKGWQQEAAMRMLMNNLDPEVAEKPDELIVYGGTADTTHAYSVGTADVFGLPLRSDTFGDIIVNNASSLVGTTLITAATNYLPADRTTPSASTADVRGTFAATSSSGANKLIIRQSPQAYMVPYVTGLYGLTQYYNF